MAKHVPPQLAPNVSGLQPSAPPTARELRSQAVHRLQVGLLGLCAMLLLVAMANIIMDRARQAEHAAPSAEQSLTPEANKAATDPLVAAGVAPAAEASTAAQSAAAP
jgi:hypothetical protein